MEHQKLTSVSSPQEMIHFLEMYPLASFKKGKSKKKKKKRDHEETAEKPQQQQHGLTTSISTKFGVSRSSGDNTTTKQKNVVSKEEHEKVLSELLETIMQRFQHCVSEMSSRHAFKEQQKLQQQQPDYVGKSNYVSGLGLFMNNNPTPNSSLPSPSTSLTPTSQLLKGVLTAATERSENKNSSSEQQQQEKQREISREILDSMDLPLDIQNLEGGSSQNQNAKTKKKNQLDTVRGRLITNLYEGGGDHDNNTSRREKQEGGGGGGGKEMKTHQEIIESVFNRYARGAGASIPSKNNQRKGSGGSSIEIDLFGSDSSSEDDDDDDFDSESDDGDDGATKRRLKKKTNASHEPFAGLTNRKLPMSVQLQLERKNKNQQGKDGETKKFQSWPSRSGPFDEQQQQQQTKQQQQHLPMNYYGNNIDKLLLAYDIQQIEQGNNNQNKQQGGQVKKGGGMFVSKNKSSGAEDKKIPTQSYSLGRKVEGIQVRQHFFLPQKRNGSSPSTDDTSSIGSSECSLSDRNRIKSLNRTKKRNSSSGAGVLSSDYDDDDDDSDSTPEIEYLTGRKLQASLRPTSEIEEKKRRKEERKRKRREQREREKQQEYATNASSSGYGKGNSFVVNASGFSPLDDPNSPQRSKIGFSSANSFAKASPSAFGNSQRQDGQQQRQPLGSTGQWCNQAAVFGRELLNQVNTRLTARGIKSVLESKVRTVLYDSDSENSSGSDAGESDDGLPGHVSQKKRARAAESAAIRKNLRRHYLDGASTISAIQHGVGTFFEDSDGDEGDDDIFDDSEIHPPEDRDDPNLDSEEREARRQRRIATRRKIREEKREMERREKYRLEKMKQDEDYIREIQKRGHILTSAAGFQNHLRTATSLSPLQFKAERKWNKPVVRPHEFDEEARLMRIKKREESKNYHLWCCSFSSSSSSSWW